MEYLVTMTTHVPDGTPDQAVDDIRAREAARSRELAAAGHLLRLWRPPLRPGEWRSLGLFAAADGGQLEQVLASMPLRVWRTDEVTPLSPHPNDPAAAPGAAGNGTEFLVTFTTSAPGARAGRRGKAAAAVASPGRGARPWPVPRRRRRRDAGDPGGAASLRLD